MKRIILDIPENLEEFREYFNGMNLREVPDRDDHPYNSRIEGWNLIDNNTQKCVASAPYLETAYKRLFYKLHNL